MHAAMGRKREARRVKNGATKLAAEKLFVAANLEALTRFWVVAPTGFEPVFQP